MKPRYTARNNGGSAMSPSVFGTEVRYSSSAHCGVSNRLSKATLVGLATRIAAKICAYTYAFLVNQRLERPHGRIKDLWA
jgi:hypothetical protein